MSDAEIVLGGVDMENAGKTVTLPYPITLYTNHRPSGILWPDGTITGGNESNVERESVGWDEVVAKKVVQGVTVWDGASRNELLGDYAEIKEMWRALGIDGPGFKIASSFMTGEEQE